MTLRLFFAGVLLLLLASASITSAEKEDVFAEIDRIFDEYRLDAHIPGMVYGIVIDGRLVHVKAFGMQDTESQRPATADTLFRIASMTKSFTALSVLKLRDEGRLALDAPAEMYIPELRGWKYPTQDSPRITVRDLLSHTSGFVTDDPWGDRQTPLPERDFTEMLKNGVPFQHTPGIHMEYSNLGYALLGRIVTNVSEQSYAEYSERAILRPLGMTSSGYDVTKSAMERRALGYRWENGAWILEPTLAHGAFGAMGGLQTTANDYAKYVAWLLSAWPPRDDADAGPVKRSSVRELARGLSVPQLRDRASRNSNNSCRQAWVYGMGWWVIKDCDLGTTMIHGGGYPGYGSSVMLLPEYGAGIFAFANRTYSGPRVSVWDAALILKKENILKERSAKVTDSLAKMYSAVAKIYESGDVTSASDSLAMNFLMDRTAANWKEELISLKSQVGTCDTSSAILPTGALSGDFTWRCEHGRVKGSVLLAPTEPPSIQALQLMRANP